MPSLPRLSWTLPLLLAACSSDPTPAADAGVTDAPSATDAPTATDAPVVTDAPVAERPMVMTTRGPVLGVTEDGIRHFFGIPYAAPPIGPLRWRAPEPAAQWTALRDRLQQGRPCPQAPGSL
nr:carboxylesterase family protein [Deltaproteobacteria bacterium]